MRGTLSYLVVVAVGLLAIEAGAAILTGSFAAPAAINKALSTFLVVGLPAPGLPALSVVIFVVLFPAMAVAGWASARGHTLTTVGAPVLALGAATILVAPVGVPWWSPAALAVAISAVLVADVRNDLAALPPLVGTSTELRRHSGWWRPLAQAIPALAALVGVIAVVPLPATFDLRQYVDPDTVTVEDPNPLAVAARWKLLEEPEPAATVSVEGENPGRLRLAVLGGYSEVGWDQIADFQVTGDRFSPDPLYGTTTDADADPLGNSEAPATDSSANPPPSSVTITREGTGGFMAVPTAGNPVLTDDPGGLRFSPAAGTILATDPDRVVSYEAAPMLATAPDWAEPLIGEFPPELAECPASDGLRAVAEQLTAGTTSTTERISAIENWLLTRRIYDPTAPGGQTIGSIETFLAQPFARGNLEAFVTIEALLARCAGIPVRVVVGYPAPEPGETSYSQSDITAWVEVPLAESGWVPFDPLPTPEEQQLQAQLAQQEPPQEQPEPPSETSELREVEPTEAPGSSTAWIWLLVGLVVLALVAAWTLLAPALVKHRRRRFAKPADSVLGAWTTSVEALSDHGIPVGHEHTPTEVVRLTAGAVPVSAPVLVAGLVPLMDKVTYAGDGATDDDAELAWGYADELARRLPATFSTRTAALTHPVRILRRLRSTLGIPAGSPRAGAELPDTSVISAGTAPEDIPDVGIQARIGDGSTGTVFRGVLLTSDTPVAVKVFRFGPGDPGFDDSRFEWEARIARDVSGLPHLPVVYSAGITPITGRPYIVSALYERGTLLDHIQRGGPMTVAEAEAVGGDLAAALDSLHRMGVVHSDIKPENVFASDDGWVLGDLGSAWLRTSHGPASSLTPPYAAPEVWRGASPDAESDLYSLALTMLFARTGRVPVAGNPPPVDEVLEAFPDLPILALALDSDPRRRPSTVAELGRELRPGWFNPVTGGGVMTLNLPTTTVSAPSKR